jgi:hypothetical protein
MNSKAFNARSATFKASLSGTSPLGRYQGRTAWLVPFALALASLASRSGAARAQDSARSSDSLP